jgi:arginine-tRNA-protein transferase
MIDKKNEFFHSSGECAYIKEQKENIHYKIMYQVDHKTLSQYIQHGWRRFGALVHRPICDGCNKCQSLRIDVDEFNFSKSIRRVIRKNKDTRVYISSPSVDDTKIALHNKYHKFMEEKKGWEYKEIDKEGYYKSFLSSNVEGAYEITYFIENQLVGIDIVDIINDGISSTYFVYDPDFIHLSLGNFSIYQNILLAKTKSLKWFYLGYYVDGCESLDYKSKFKPFYILQDRPDIDEEAIWLKETSL